MTTIKKKTQTTNVHTRTVEEVVGAKDPSLAAAYHHGLPPMSLYHELEEAWLAGELTHAEASALAAEAGYEDEWPAEDDYR